MRLFSFLLQYFIFCVLGAQDCSQFFCGTKEFQRAHIGICIADVETGEIKHVKNADQYFIPASLQKIVTSVAAIHFLGEDYHFYTELQIEGNIDNGVLHGNVWIQGGGDPTLDFSVLEEWKTDLTKQGIRRVDGKICIDASHFEMAAASPYWFFEDLGNYYGAGASALTLHQNLYRISFKPGLKEGDPAEIVQIDPPMPHLQLHNEVTTGPAGSGDQVYVFGVEYSPIQFFRGTVPRGESSLTVKAMIPDPPLLCGHLFSKLMEPTGIEVFHDQKSSKRTVISQHLSPPMKEILKEMNHRSNNLYAEHLFKGIGAGKACMATSKIEDFLQSLSILAHIRDGSGLARNNAITPRGFVDVLILIRKSPQYRDVYTSFPEAGEGTLQNFPSLSKGGVKAKTGSMTGITNLGGYLKLASGKEYAFCLFCNHFDGSTAEVKQEMQEFLEHFANTHSY